MNVIKKEEYGVVGHLDGLTEVEENFVSRLKKGIGKYKGELTFKCFNCGRIGHFSSKCTFKEDNYMRGGDRIKREVSKRSIYSKGSSYLSKD